VKWAEAPQNVSPWEGMIMKFVVGGTVGGLLVAGIVFLCFAQWDTGEIKFAQDRFQSSISRNWKQSYTKNEKSKYRIRFKGSQFGDFENRVKIWFEVAGSKTHNDVVYHFNIRLTYVGHLTFKNGSIYFSKAWLDDQHWTGVADDKIRKAFLEGFENVLTSHFFKNPIITFSADDLKKAGGGLHYRGVKIYGGVARFTFGSLW